MSTLLRLSTPRLEKAIARVGLKDGELSIWDLRKALTRRGMSDQAMHSMFHALIDVLEPPQCYMTHCKNFGGSGAPMNCRLERVPGRCTILKEFKIRREARAAAVAEKDAEKPASEWSPGKTVVPNWQRWVPGSQPEHDPSTQSVAHDYPVGPVQDGISK